MRTLLKNRIQRVHQHRSLNVWPRLAAGLVLVFSLSTAQAQLAPEVIQRQKGYITKGDFHAVAIAFGGWESTYKEGQEAKKLPFIKDTVNMAVTILDLCDPTTLDKQQWLRVDPPFDWNKYGIKPLFNGVSPDAIENDEAREAYKKALAEHQKLRARVHEEDVKATEADYCSRVARDVLKSCANQPAALAEVRKHIETIRQKWIRERLGKIVLNETPSK